MQKLVLSFCLIYSSTYLAQNTLNQEHRDFFHAKNRFKVGITDAFRGNILFYYERLIAKQHALEVGIGPSFNDFLFNFHDNSSAHVPLGSIKNVRYAFSLSYKYRPFKGISFLYVGAGAKLRAYHSTNYMEYEPFQSQYYTHGLKYTKLELLPTLKIRNYFAINNERIILEYAVGVGYSITDIRHQSSYYNYYTPGTGSGQLIISEHHAKEKKIVLAIEFKIGFGLLDEKTKSRLPKRKSGFHLHP
jgi:hypothetical protein